MRWNVSDIEKFNQASEFVDTLIFPLAPFQLTGKEDDLKLSYQNEVLRILTGEIERNLSGRLMHLPNYNYLNESDYLVESKRIKSWIKSLETLDFKQVFFITFDAKWKRNEDKLPGNLLWIPALQSLPVNSSEFKNHINEQVNQLSDLIQSFW